MFELIMLITLVNPQGIKMQIPLDREPIYFEKESDCHYGAEVFLSSPDTRKQAKLKSEKMGYKEFYISYACDEQGFDLADKIFGK